jgi:hypothetical protein
MMAGSRAVRKRRETKEEAREGKRSTEKQEVALICFVVWYSFN